MSLPHLVQVAQGGFPPEGEVFGVSARAGPGNSAPVLDWFLEKE